MTIWKTELNTGNKAQALASLIADAIANGELQAGEKLPTQRALAEQLQLGIGTITRALALAEQQGHIQCKVGSGCYVKAQNQRQWGEDEQPDSLGMWQNLAVDQDRASPLLELFQLYQHNPAQLNQLLNDETAQGALFQRQILAEWLNQASMRAEQLFFCYGGQHGLQTALLASGLAGQSLMCEELCYPGLSNLARQLNIKLKPVKLDEQGLCPDSLEAVLQHNSCRHLYLTPNQQNPTASTMSLERRERIVELAQHYQLTVIEDDVSSPLVQSPATLQSLLPEQVIYLNSFSKGVFRGLRFGYLHVPQTMIQEFTRSIRANAWLVSPLLIDLACQWIKQGHAEHALAQQANQLKQRAALLHHYLKGFDYRYQEGGLHCWLQLPSGWSSNSFAEAAKQQGLELASAEHFSVSGQVPNAIRLSLGQLSDNLALDQALALLRQLLNEGVPNSSDLC